MRKRDYLRPDELERLLSAAGKTRNPERDYALLLVMFRHALRVSEACSVKVSDLNLELGEVFVHRAKGSASGAHPLYKGETAALKAWLAIRAKMSVPEQVDTLFVSEQRKPLNRVSVWYLIKGLAGEAGIEAHPHSLRHSCGYDLVNKGHDVRLIGSFMCHKSISSTIRYTAIETRRYAKLF
jgi:type 1 fimbriae regulatory protein FimB